MKWPLMVTLIRHGESAYNELRKKKAADPLYLEFKKEYEKNYRSVRARELAMAVRERFALGIDDYRTPLTEEGERQCRVTGAVISKHISLPDIVLISPNLRTTQSRECLIDGWPELGEVKFVPDDRIREQDHGLAILYNDWRVFHVLHPEQKELYDLRGPYWYKYPQGEDVSNVRDRERSFTSTLIREYAGCNALVVTHHLTKLSFRANHERLTPEQFIELDAQHKPVNCGVTLYRGNPQKGRNGKLELEYYNRQFWT